MQSKTHTNSDQIRGDMLQMSAVSHLWENYTIDDAPGACVARLAAMVLTM